MLYEVVLVIRPDISLKQVGSIAQDIEEMIQAQGGEVQHSEYWGFRTLAYRIGQRAKAYYVCLMISIGTLEKLYHMLKFHKDILRFLCIKRPEGFKVPTALFQSSIETLHTQEEIMEEESLSGDAS